MSLSWNKKFERENIDLDGSFNTHYNTHKLKLCLNYIVDWIGNVYKRE